MHGIKNISKTSSFYEPSDSIFFLNDDSNKVYNIHNIAMAFIQLMISAVLVVLLVALIIFWTIALLTTSRKRG